MRKGEITAATLKNLNSAQSTGSNSNSITNLNQINLNPTSTSSNPASSGGGII